MKLNIIFHSIHGHGYDVAKAIKQGAESIADVEVNIYRVEETLSEEVISGMNASEDIKKMDEVPVATLENLQEADGIILGAPTYFGAPSAQMFAFLNSAGNEWVNGLLIGKIGSAYTTTAEQNGGAETCLQGINTFFFHQGMIVVSQPTALSYKQMHTVDKPVGGYAYGASMITGGLDNNVITKEEIEVAKLQGETVARTIREISIGRGCSKDD